MRPSSAMSAAACVLAMALGACSYIAPRSSPPPTPTPTLSQRELDVNAANAMVLVVANIPPGYGAADHHRSSDELSDTKRIQSCLGATAPARFSADIDGQDFTKGELQISTSVTVTPTLSEARRDQRAYAGAKFRPCVIQVLRADAGPALVSLTVHRISVERFGDSALGYRLVARLKDQTHTATYYNDIVFFFAGRAQVAASFANTARLFPAGLERTLVRRLGAKVKRV